MKNYKLLILLIIYFISPSSIFSQTNDSISVFDTTISFTLHKNIKPYSVHFVIIDSVEVTIYKTKIYNNNRYLIQSLDDTINFMGKESRMMVDRFSYDPPNPNFNNDISFVDINFDGYTDLKIKSFVTMEGTSEFNYYLYNPDSNKFIYNQEFSNLDGNLSLDAKLKEITSTIYDWREETDYTEIYKIIDNKPVLVMSKIKAVPLEDRLKGNDQIHYIHIEKLIDGVMKTVVDTVETE